jgi:hypothetical protein
MMSRENVEVVRSIYRGFARRDRQALVAQLDPSIRVHDRLSHPDASVYEGAEGFLRFSETDWEAFEDVVYEPHGAGLSVAMREEERRGGGRSEPQRGAHGDHRRSSGVHGVDDLAAVDALQVDGRDAEVAVSELALDHDERHALASHLDGVGAGAGGARSGAALLPRPPCAAGPRVPRPMTSGGRASCR